MSRNKMIKIEYSDPEQVYSLFKKLLHRNDVKPRVKKEIRALLNNRTVNSSETALEGTAALHALYWTYR